MRQTNTTLVMMLSAIFLAAIGISLTFFPNEIAGLTGIPPSKTLQLIFQILGALFFAFAMLNWMAKGTIIGGIYNKPVSVANLTHFIIGALALVKAILSDHTLPYGIWTLAGIYSVFAILFAIIFSQHPVMDKKS